MEDKPSLKRLTSEIITIDSDSDDENVPPNPPKKLRKHQEEDKSIRCPLCARNLLFLPIKIRQDHITTCLAFSEVKPVKKEVKPLIERPRHAIDRKPENPVLESSNAFLKMMETSNEIKQWKNVDDLEAANKGVRLGKNTQKSVPFYKWIEGLPITVDAFKYGFIEGCDAYFLSHAHSDHYQNLSSSWKHGPIYCSEVTAALIKLKLHVDDEWLRPLPLDTPCVVAGTTVTLIDANHCPGSTLFLFEASNGKNYLHCGDFRASLTQLNHPSLKNKSIDGCYLDTTYLNPKYCFPRQIEVINACKELVLDRVRILDHNVSTGGLANKLLGWLTTSSSQESKGHRLLVLVGTYSIGKERIAKGVAQALRSKIYCDDRKRPLLDAQNDTELDEMLVNDPLEASVHIVMLHHINVEYAETYMKQFKTSESQDFFTHVLALKPTGWAYKPASLNGTQSLPAIMEREAQKVYTASNMYADGRSTATCSIYSVPYSEHSSFYELTCFALSLNYRKMIPTVNIETEDSRSRMKHWFEAWKREKTMRTAIQNTPEKYW